MDLYIPRCNGAKLDRFAVRNWTKLVSTRMCIYIYIYIYIYMKAIDIGAGHMSWISRDILRSVIGFRYQRERESKKEVSHLL